MNKIYYLYRHCRKDNNTPFYVGIGSKYEISKSYKRAYEYRGRNNLWKTYVEKYGYYVEILYESYSQDEILQKEKEFIALYGRISDKGILCNVTTGGTKPSQIPLTDEQKRHLSIKMRGRRKPEGFSKKLSERNKGNKYNLGKPLSDETKIKISNSNRKFYESLSEEEKDKIKIRLLEAANKPKLNYNKTEKYEKNKQLQRKQILQFDMSNNFIKEYNSMSDAAFINNLSIGKISLCCNGKRKSHGKFIWKFKENI